MTKEELRAHCEKQVKMCEEWAKGNDREPSGKIYEEHKLILDLIKALEQQPSDDCVSRSEIIDELNRLGRNAFKDDTDYDNFFAFVDSLPSVTPIRKVGKWIKYEKEFTESGTYRQIKRPVIECSICHEKIAGYIGIMKYCPNCGAEMRGSENG